MVVDLSDAFDSLADTQYWTDVAMVFGGYMGAKVLRAAIENFSGQNLPDEVYGLAVGGLGASMGYPMVAAGGGLYSVDKLTQTLGVQSSVVGMVGGA